MTWVTSIADKMTAPASSSPTNGDPLADLQSIDTILSKLQEAYLRSQENDGETAQSARRASILRDLAWCRALLRNVVSRGLFRDERPVPHVVVFGGTQVGKSTAANILLGGELARVHHTAGFTRHAQGFVPPSIPVDAVFGENTAPFESFLRVGRAQLSPDRLNEYTLDSMERDPATGRVVVWDAPDCDAVGSTKYLLGLVEALSIADAVVYVTSNQKYAIQHVLDWLCQVRAAGCPVTAVLNTTPKRHLSDLMTSMNEAYLKVAENVVGAPREPLNIVGIEPVPDGDVSILYGRDYLPSQQLRESAGSLARESHTAPGKRAVAAADYIGQRLADLVEPALAEMESATQWRQQVDESLAGFVEDYKRHYLDDASQYDAFNYVGVEILALLDPPIPGARKAITAVRSVLSVPARLVLYAGRSVWKAVNQEGGEGDAAKQPKDIATVRDAHERMLNALAHWVTNQSSRSNDRAFWPALEWCWERIQKELDADFRQQALQLRESHQARIRTTAEKLYAELAKDPVKLNLLRTGRLGADAAAILLSIKSFGHGDLLHELVVAPVILSVVEAVTQALADNYVETLKTELKTNLLADTQDFAQRVYRARLMALSDDAISEAGFAALEASDLSDLTGKMMKLRSRLEGAAS